MNLNRVLVGALILAAAVVAVSLSAGRSEAQSLLAQYQAAKASEHACAEAGMPGRYQVVYITNPMNDGAGTPKDQAILLDSCTGETWGGRGDGGMLVHWQYLPRVSTEEGE